jgi:hypothetical protein
LGPFNELYGKYAYKLPPRSSLTTVLDLCLLDYIADNMKRGFEYIDGLEYIDEQTDDGEAEL